MSATLALTLALTAGAGHAAQSGTAVTALAQARFSTAPGRVVVVDATPPETRIVAGPRGAVTSSSVTFTVSGADDRTPADGLRYAWRLDGGAWSAFSTATTITLAELTPGPHLFEVRARDEAGNEASTPAARAFTVLGAAGCQARRRSLRSRAVRSPRRQGFSITLIARSCLASKIA